MAEELKEAGGDVDYYVADIKDDDSIRQVFKLEMPKVVYHAAAYKCVTPMERQPRQSVMTNVVGTVNVMRAAVDIAAAKFVLISTDKAAKAECVMGASKRLMEAVARTFGMVTVRFGNVIGSRGSVFEIWQRQFKNKKPLTVTDYSCERYAMSLTDAVKLVREAAEKAKPGETWIMDMGERVTLGEYLSMFMDTAGVPEGYPVKVIGLKPGESLTEEIMTAEERKRARLNGNFYVICANF